MSRRSKFVSILIFSSLALISACSQKAASVSDEDIRLSNLEPLPSIANSMVGKERQVKPGEPDYVPEPIAQSLKAQVAKWPKGEKIADALSFCSGALVAKRLGAKSACEIYSMEPESSCIAQHGYGKNSIGQALTADRRDLNGDGVKDYIISDRYYCFSLTANQASVYFVMLSNSKKDFTLAYADWASAGIVVVDDKVKGKLVLMEQAQKSYGKFSTIYELRDSKYSAKACVISDEKGYSACPLSEPQSGFD
ncbi:hypothetical protein [Duganella sp. Root198D2]|uniref:hypothetical protein n=2 Tax=unclassified Duganella TaxID=2636909 RepID=UPI0007019E4B|nr:hypothetical protein [Duganella sp. Root198D2]KQV50987.1 hypothetical protein ASD07_08675 [Duganella sp. Root336D2]KRC00565.1 hypothetical protein ASE26_22875 [Duganella sp. Root198D2]